MAKVPFSKLQACVDGCSCQTYFYNKAGDKVYYEIQHYLPMKEKIELINRVINQSIDDNGFYNPIRVKIYLTLEIVYAYTNLSFTDKMKEDPFKLYDLVVSTGLFHDVITAIEDHEYATIREDIYSTIENIYKYRNSVMGILDAVSTNYKDLNLNLDTIQEKLADPNSLSLIKEIMPLTNANMVEDI